MAYFEMVLLVMVAMTALVLLALVASSGDVSRLRSGHPQGRRRSGPPALPGSRVTPPAPVPSTRNAARRHAAARCRRQGVDWARLMEGSGSWIRETPGPRTPTVESER